jgi:hypothetical protein
MTFPHSHSQSALGVGDDWLRRVFTAVPLMQRVFRWLLYVRQELLFVVGFTPARWTGRAFVDAMRVILSGQVAAGVRAAATAAAASGGSGAVQSEEAIQAKTRGLLKTLTPSYLPGCKRLLIRFARHGGHRTNMAFPRHVLIHLHVSAFPLNVFYTLLSLVNFLIYALFGFSITVSLSAIWLVSSAMSTSPPSRATMSSSSRSR